MNTQNPQNTQNRITEQFLSIQGEGRSTGRLAYFIRFGGCNLWCKWCDSMHSVDPEQMRGKLTSIRYDEVPGNCKLVVLTGGEPTLFDLLAVRERLAIPDRVFEVESNATVFPNAPTNTYHDLFHWNLSPKLASSQQKSPALDQKRLQKLADWANYARARTNVTFKFVVCGAADILEVDTLVNTHSIAAHQVFLMHEGSTRESQDLPAVEWIVEHCKLRGYNYSPRLHVALWGDRRGV